MDVAIALLSLGAVLSLGPALLIDALIQRGSWVDLGAGGIMISGPPWPWPLRRLFESVQAHPRRLTTFRFRGKVLGAAMALGAASTSVAQAVR